MKSATKGLSWNDRELAGRVRTLALHEVEKALKRGKGRFYEAVLIRLAGTLLPRLNEVTGENGGPLIIELPKAAVEKYGIDIRSRKNS